MIIYFRVEFQAPTLNILHRVQHNISFNVKHNTVHILLLHCFKIFVLNNRKYLYSLSVSFEEMALSLYWFFFNKVFSQLFYCNVLLSKFYAKILCDVCMEDDLCGRAVQLPTWSLGFDIPAPSPQCTQKSELVS